MALGAGDLHQQHDVGGDGVAFLDFFAVVIQTPKNGSEKLLDLPFSQPIVRLKATLAREDLLEG